MLIINKSTRTHDAIYSAEIEDSILILSVCNQEARIDLSQMNEDVDFNLTDIKLAYNPISSVTYNATTGDIEVNCFFDDIYTPENLDPRYKHIKNTYTFDSRIAEYKTDAIAEASKVASGTIYATYPEYAQQNLTTDSSYAMNVIANEMDKTIPQINGEMFALIQNLNSVAKMVAFRSTIDSVDLTSYVASAPSAQQAGLINAYRNILYSITSYKIIKFVRTWCNEKVIAINACTTVEQVKAITFTDCPSIA